MKRLGRLVLAAALLAALVSISACQRTVEVQTGTRIVDSQGRVISEDIKTVRVPQESAGAYRINTIIQADPAEVQAAGLYAEAQTAIRSGNLKLAAKKLAEVIAVVPNYRNAKKQADAIKAGKKVTPDTTPAKPANPTTSTPPATKPSGLTSSLLRWMPDNITGFTAAKADVYPVSVSRQYIPGSGSSVQTLVIVAEQFRTSADAKRALDINVKQKYTKSSSTSKVHGHTIYFGTDGRRFAAIGFTSGAVMIALEASPNSGSPSTMRSALEKVLGQLP